jgi:hypothetical protein
VHQEVPHRAYLLVASPAWELLLLLAAYHRGLLEGPLVLRRGYQWLALLRRGWLRVLRHKGRQEHHRGLVLQGGPQGLGRGLLLGAWRGEHPWGLQSEHSSAGWSAFSNHNTSDMQHVLCIMFGWVGSMSACVGRCTATAGQLVGRVRCRCTSPPGYPGGGAPCCPGIMPGCAGGAEGGGKPPPGACWPGGADVASFPAKPMLPRTW